jgi:excisionase family DNA binding protein
VFGGRGSGACLLRFSWTKIVRGLPLAYLLRETGKELPQHAAAARRLGAVHGELGAVHGELAAGPADRVAEVNERTVIGASGQGQLARHEPAGQQRRATAQRGRRDADDHLVQQAMAGRCPSTINGGWPAGLFPEHCPTWNSTRQSSTASSQGGPTARARTAAPTAPRGGPRTESLSAADPLTTPRRPPGAHERLVYSVEDAAEILGISPTFMFQLITTGQIDSFKIGSRRKIHRDAAPDADHPDKPREAVVFKLRVHL